MFELVDAGTQKAVIKVIGVGGGGGNCVQHMLDSGIKDVDFFCANTDAQALKKIPDKMVLQLGANVTNGLGAGADPDIGRQSAIEDRERIKEALEGADMIFITAGMGGGTGTGASPVIAEVAKGMGILTVAVVTRPFTWEGNKRAKIADNGIKELAQYADSLITIPNQNLIDVLGADTKIEEAFSIVNDVLLEAVEGITQLITRPGQINVDFADVRTVMSEMGMAMIGTGKAQGEGRVDMATNAAINSPLLENVSLSGARGILVNITSGKDMSLGELNQIGEAIKKLAAEDATVVVGTTVEPDMAGEIRVTIVATGLGLLNAEENIREVVDNSSKKPTHNYKHDNIDVNSEKYFDIPAFLRNQAD